MTQPPGPLSIRRLSGQIAALLLIALFVGQIASTAIESMRQARMQALYPGTVGVLATAMRLLATAGSAEQEALLIAAVNREFPELQLAATDAAGALATPEGFTSSVLQRSLGPDYIIDIDDSAIQDLTITATIVVTIPDGRRFTAVLARPPLQPGWGPGETAILLVAIAGLGILLCVFWVVRAIARPATALAKAAADVDLDARLQPMLKEEGPWELRTVSRAFNSLLKRVSLLVQSKTIALTAISHDLRTPITRIRLRSEKITDETIRADIIRDLDHMASIVTNVLRVVSGDEQQSAHEMLDIAALLETICTDFSDQGFDVAYEGSETLLTCGSPDDLSRLFTNLVTNATRFGSKIQVRLEVEDGRPIAIVEDNGPGIPTSQREIVLQPFMRGEQERGGDGVGLGLAIAQAIAMAHKARIELGESAMGGLHVRVRFPAAV